MLLLTSTSDLITVITGSTGSVKVHASWVDNLAGAITPGRTNTAFITTATTTTVVGSPAASTQRNVKMLSIRNDHASTSNLITVNHTDGTTVEVLWAGTLLAQESAVFDQEGKWTYYDSSGNIKDPTRQFITTESVSAVTGYAADTYLVGSSIAIPTGLPAVGSRYKLRYDVTKTGAGTAAPTCIIRIGTAGAIGDAAILTFTGNAQTAVIDNGVFTVIAVFRTVGSGTSAVLQGTYEMRHNLAVTGLGSVNPAGYQALYVTSSGFNSTTANLIIGASINGGASAAWTVNLVDAEFLP